MTLRTITVITTDRTASAAHGTGAGIIPLGIRGASLLGDTTDGTIRGTTAATGDGMIHGTIADGTEDGMTLGTAGMIHGTTAAIGADGMTLGITAMPDGTADSGDHITPDGTADGILSGRACITDITSDWDQVTIMDTITSTPGEARDIRPEQTEYSQAATAAEADSEYLQQHHVTSVPDRPRPYHAGQRHLQTV